MAKPLSLRQILPTSLQFSLRCSQVCIRLFKPVPPLLFLMCVNGKCFDALLRHLMLDLSLARPGASEASDLRSGCHDSRKSDLERLLVWLRPDPPWQGASRQL